MRLCLRFWNRSGGRDDGNVEDNGNLDVDGSGGARHAFPGVPPDFGPRACMHIGHSERR